MRISWDTESKAFDKSINPIQNGGGGGGGKKKKKRHYQFFLCNFYKGRN